MCLKLFSDSTQDAKDLNCKKEVSGRVRGYYYSEAAKAIFTNDDDLDVRHCSQVQPDLFAMKIDHRIKEYISLCFTCAYRHQHVQSMKSLQHREQETWADWDWDDLQRAAEQFIKVEHPE